MRNENAILTKTYKGKSPAAILRTAKVEQMRAGNYEVTVQVDGRTALAHLAVRRDGWGDCRDDVMIIADAQGEICRLVLGTRATQRLTTLTSQADNAMRTDLQ